VTVRRLTTTACVLAAGGCAWLPEPASRQAQEVRDLWGPYAIVAAAVTALVLGLLVVVIVRDRRRDPDEMPRQVAYNIPVEVAYLVVPLAVLAWLGVGALRTQDVVEAVDGPPDVVVDVVAFRWQWQFTYRGEDVVVGDGEVEPELVLPAPAVVEFHGTSRDVVHSFWVPDYLFKRDMTPGRTTVFQIDTLEPGEHIGECAEYCGLDHARMGFTVRTVTPDEFEAWLDEARRSSAERSP
jgi:cytochrome c oxidase subunit 2